MICTATTKGFEVPVTAYATDGGDLIYMRMLAAPTVDKAVWAAMNSAEARKGKSGIYIRFPGDDHHSQVSPAKYTQYTYIRTVLPCGYTDMAFIHPEATAAAGDVFYLVAESPSPPAAFFPMLNARLLLPLLPEWATWLWEGGLEGYLPEGHRREYYHSRPIKAIDARGGYIYQVDATLTEEWMAIIRRGLSFDPAAYDNEDRGGE